MIDWIVKRVVKLVSPKYIANWGRHLATTLVGALIAAGYLSHGESAETVKVLTDAFVGLLGVAITVALSIANSDKLEAKDPPKVVSAKRSGNE